MSLPVEILKYLDGYRLVSPHALPTPLTPGNSSGNGTMYRSEYAIMLNKLGYSFHGYADSWQETINTCMLEPGLLARWPGCAQQDSPDNLLGVLAACVVLDRHQIAKDILTYGIKHLGWYNQPMPGTVWLPGHAGINWSAYMWRQPQLFFLNVVAAKAYKWYKFWLWPSMVYTSLVILYSALQNIDPQNTDPRRLSWLLIQGTKSVFLCRFAGKLWYHKLYKQYPNGMKDVAAIYYEKGHPFAKYWVT